MFKIHNPLDDIQMVTIEVKNGTFIHDGVIAALELHRILNVKVILSFNGRFYLPELCSVECEANGEPIATPEGQ